MKKLRREKWIIIKINGFIFVKLPLKVYELKMLVSPDSMKMHISGIVEVSFEYF